MVLDGVAVVIRILLGVGMELEGLGLVFLAVAFWCSGESIAPLMDSIIELWFDCLGVGVLVMGFLWF